MPLVDVEKSHVYCENTHAHFHKPTLSNYTLRCHLELLENWIDKAKQSHFM